MEWPALAVGSLGQWGAQWGVPQQQRLVGARTAVVEWGEPQAALSGPRPPAVAAQGVAVARGRLREGGIPGQEVGTCQRLRVMVWRWAAEVGPPMGHL